jgi:hypothetical protein
MKNLFVSFLFVFVSFVSFSQKINVEVKELLTYKEIGDVNYSVILKDSVSDFPLKSVGGVYNIDLNTKTLKFKTLSGEGVRQISSFNESDGVFTVIYNDGYLDGNSGKKLEVKMIIDSVSNKVVYTFFDPINNYTLVQDFTKNKISVN